MEAAELAGADEWRARLGARRQLGRGRAGGRRQDQGAGAATAGAEIGEAADPAGDARFGPRPDADPRLPRARPSARRSRSAGPRAAPRPRGAASRRTTASPKPTGTARSSSTTCSGWSSRTIREIVAHPASAPIARRSASSSCTSPTRPRRPGSRSASKGRTRRSPSPARASARSSTSSSRRKASRSSSTSNTPAPSASASTAAKSLIPALEQIIKRGGKLGVKEIVLGMAHRGRLNVLTQVMGKPHRAIFHEFKGGSFAPDEVEGSGDVKYHLGASSDREFDGNNVHLSLTAEPVASRDRRPGRARQGAGQAGPAWRPARAAHARSMPLLIHGDAAFAGQGVVAECFGLSGLQGPPHRRLGAFHRQQPDRLHDQSALLALLALSVRRRQDGRGADLPLQRRRPGGGGLRGEGRDRVPPAVSRSRSSSTCSATAASATTKATSRPSPSRMMYRLIRQHPDDAGDLRREARRRRRRHRGRGRGR